MGIKTDFQGDSSVRLLFFVFSWLLFVSNLVGLFLTIKDPHYLKADLFLLFFITFPLVVVGTLFFGFDRYSVDDESIKILFYRKQYGEIKKESIYVILYAYSCPDYTKRYIRPTLYIIPLCIKDIEEIQSCDFSVCYKLKPDNEILRFLDTCKDVIKITGVYDKKMRVLLKHGYKVINCFNQIENNDRHIDI